MLAPLALGACAPPAPAGDPACRRACEADAMESARRVCGTDRRTWTACEWLCGAVPAGVSVWPGACGSDGAPPAERPASPADGQSVCDWARVGGSWIAVECTDGVRGVTEVGTAPMGGMPFEHRSPADLPAEVDHRARFGPVRTQGQTNACTAFTTVAALEGALAVQGASATLSEMHLWARYHTPSSDAAIVAARHGGIASAQAAAAAGFAFDDARARAWTTDAAHPTATERPDPAVLAQLDAAGEFQVTAVNVIDPPAGREVPTADQLRAALADGLDVAAAFSTGDPWARAGADGVIADYGYSGRGAHAVLLVGYRAIGGQTYFIVRNSWGPAWGDAGYGYLPAHAAEANLLQAWVVSVRNAATARTAPRCAEGEAAGLDRVCRRVCPDGAFADASGACPGATGAACPSGGVRDASGVCVDACAAGDDAGDGFAVHCAQHGCTWTIDDGAFGCSGGPCVAYCPAPACQLVVDTDVATGEPSWSCAAPEP